MNETYVYEIIINWFNNYDYKMVSESKGFYATEDLAEEAQELIAQDYGNEDHFMSHIVEHKVHTSLPQT